MTTTAEEDLGSGTRSGRGDEFGQPEPGGRTSAARAWMRRHRRLVLLVPVMLVAFGVRLVAIYDALPGCGPGGQAASVRICFEPTNDSAYYLDQARALRAGEGFVDPAAARRGVRAEGAAHPPLYPLVLAVAGAAGFEDDNALRVLGGAIGAIGIGLIGLLAARAAGAVAPGRQAAVAVTAATIAALYPPLWLADVRLQPEVLVVPLTAVLLGLALGPARRPRPWPAAALGAVGGLLTLTRQDGLAVFVAVLATLVFGAWRRSASGRDPSVGHAGWRGATLRGVGLAVAGFLAVVGPWVIYNLSRFPEPVVLTTGSSVVALYGNCDPAWTGPSRGTYDFTCVPASFSSATDESELASWTRRAAFDHVEGHLTEVPGVLATRAARLWQLYAPFDTADRDTTLEGRGHPWPLVGTWATWLVLGSAGLGLVAAHHRHLPVGVLIAVPVAVTAVAMASFAVTRFRIPAEVPLVVLAAIGLEATAHHLHRRWFRRTDRAHPDGPDPWLAVNRWAWTVPVFVTALTVRLGAVLVWRPECRPDQMATGDTGQCWFLFGDAHWYVRQAVYIESGAGFRTGVGETAQHPPLFPVLLAGLRKAGMESVQSQRVGLALLGALGAVLVGLVGYRIGGRAVGLLAGLGAALAPNLWLAEEHLMSEALFTIVTALVLLAAYSLHRRPTFGRAAMLGAAIGLAWLTRAEAGLLLALLIPPLLWRAAVPVTRRLAIGGLTAAVALALVSPWMLMNLTRFEEPVLYTTNVGQTLLLGACDDVFYGPGTGFYSFGCAQGKPVTSIDESIGDRENRDRALAYYRDHADRVPAVLAVRALRMWNLWDPIDTFRRDVFVEGRGYAAALGHLVATVVLAPVALIGLVHLRRRRVPISPLLACVAVATVTAVLAAPVPRYRVGADVALIVAAAVGLHLLAFGRTKEDPPVAGEPAEVRPPPPDPTDRAGSDRGTEASTNTGKPATAGVSND